MMRSFLKLTDFTAEEILFLIEEARRLKRSPVGPAGDDYSLRGRSLGLLFFKASTRTRVSFEVAMARLGGSVTHIDPQTSQLGRGESVSDTAKVLSRYLDLIAIRADDHAMLEEFRSTATIPVINALSDRYHPCQALADLFTFRERFGELAGLKLAYVGDGNNVAHSLMLASAMMGIDIRLASPSGYEPDESVCQEAFELARASGASIEVMTDPRRAVKDADILYTDVWVSMGQDAQSAARMKAFGPTYQINAALLELASDRAVVAHCLPAHRGMEISAEVLDGARSIIWEQAENRLYAQQSLILKLIEER